MNLPLQDSCKNTSGVVGMNQISMLRRINATNDAALLHREAVYRFFHLDDGRWALNAIDSLAVPPPKVSETERVNVLITTRQEQDVRKLFDLARADYEAAARR